LAVFAAGSVVFSGRQRPAPVDEPNSGRRREVGMRSARSEQLTFGKIEVMSMRKRQNEPRQRRTAPADWRATRMPAQERTGAPRGHLRFQIDCGCGCPSDDESLLELVRG